MWFVKKYFGLSAKEMRTVQEIIYQNIATRSNERGEVDFSSFSFNRARLLEFLGEVIKWKSRDEYLTGHFEALRKLTNYEPVDKWGISDLAEVIDDFITRQLIEMKENDLWGKDLTLISGDDKEKLQRRLKEIASRIPDRGTLSVSLEQIAPHQKSDRTYTMLRTILDIAEVQPYAVHTQHEREILAKLQHRVPVSKEEIDKLTTHVECFRWVI